MRLSTRLHGLLIRWGLLKHPFGRAYARRRYTVTGRYRDGGASAAHVHLARHLRDFLEGEEPRGGDE